ncbi:MAG: mRNA-degrading endonuclease RelE of RelBE toxin-antitoxin system [bacterium]|jgi:mRNA-degrading endonuclease RelE of RelBE toxin-antitoxin system
MKFKVNIKKKVEKGLDKLPKQVKQLFFLLIEDLKADGPIQKDWHNFSPLGKEKYHCHLNYRYVACWSYSKNEILIEVYYVGSREKAPY